MHHRVTCLLAAIWAVAGWACGGDGSTSSTSNQATASSGTSSGTTGGGASGGGGGGGATTSGSGGSGGAGSTTGSGGQGGAATSGSGGAGGGPAAIQHLWSKGFDCPNLQRPASMAVDNAGNVIFAGTLYGSCDFGGGMLTSAGNSDIFVVKLDSDGNHLWSKQFGNALEQSATSVAVDAAGNVIVAGNFEGSINFGGGLLSNAVGSNLFVLQLAPDGSYKWAIQADAPATVAVAAAPSGDVLLAGGFSNSINFGGGTLTSAGSADIFVAKLSSSGNHVWSKRYGDASLQKASAIAVDASGNVIVTGEFGGSFNLGFEMVTSLGEDIFVVKLDSNGNWAWSKAFGDQNKQYGPALTTDPNGNVVLATYAYGSVNFGGGTLTSAGGADILVAKFDPAGTHIWSKRFGGPTDNTIDDVAADVQGNVIISGRMAASVDFGGGPLPSSGNLGDALVVKLSPQGTHLWSATFGDAGNQTANAVGTDPSGNVFLAGSFDGSLDFGGGPLAGGASEDVFVVKLGP